MRALLAFVALVALPLTASAQTWTEHKSTVCKATAQLPGTPAESKQELDTDAGKRTMTMYILELGSSALGYGCVDGKGTAGGRTVEQRLNDARDGMLGNMNAKLTKESNFTFEGTTAREIRGDIAGQYTVVARLMYVADVYYQTMAVYESKEAKKMEPDVAKFLDSFKLNASTAKKKGK